MEQLEQEATAGSLIAVKKKGKGKNHGKTDKTYLSTGGVSFKITQPSPFVEGCVTPL